MSRSQPADRASHRAPQASAASAKGAAHPVAGAPGGGKGSEASSLSLKTAAIYARVSTEKQEKEETIESQMDALRSAARERGYELPSEYVFADEGLSGAHLDRPGLERLRDLAAEGAFDVILIYSPDRLARQYAYQVVVCEELKRAGCEVVFLNHAFGQTPEEQMLLQVQGVFAEYERALIKERTRRGRIFAARQGRVSWGTAPYGYRYVRKTDTTPQSVVIEEKEAEVVREMYRWLVEEQITSRAIQSRLNQRGVPSRKGRLAGWWQSAVMRVLANPMYKGEGYYNRQKRADARRPRGEHGFKDLRPGNLRSRALRPREEWIPVTVPAIIDSETWRLAQEQLTHNKERATRHNKKHEYLLRSLLVCGHCGRRVQGSWMRNGGYYICPNRYPKGMALTCKGRLIAVPRTDALVWDQVKAMLSNPDLLKTQYQRGRGDPAVNVKEDQERHRIERKLAALEREIQRLVDAYQAEVIVLEELKERRFKIEEHGRMLRERLGELEKERTDREQELRVLEGLEAFCRSVTETLTEPTFEIQQKVLRLVIDRIVVEDSRLVIYHVMPIGPVRLRTDHQAEGTQDQGGQNEAREPHQTTSLHGDLLNNTAF
jgi:site-specific DNA recombinase